MGNRQSEIRARATDEKNTLFSCMQRNKYDCVYRAVSDLVHNVVQQFKDGHGRSVHSMS